MEEIIVLVLPYMISILEIIGILVVFLIGYCIFTIKQV